MSSADWVLPPGHEGIRGVFMHIVLTGEKGVGKTTVAWDLVQELQDLGHKPSGFLTEKFTCGLLLRNVGGGPPFVLALLEPNGPRGAYTQVGKYYFISESVRLGLNILRWPTELMVVDELGNWEAQSGGFLRALEIINGSQVRHSILVVRKSVLPIFLDNFQREPMVIEVTRDNRDGIAHAIAQRFHSLLTAEPLEERLNR